MDPDHDAIWPWRRSDRTFRARDLDLHRTLSGLSDGALGESCSEVQGARATSSGGSEGLGIYRTYPPSAYGGLGPVTGGQGEQRDDIANPIVLVQ